MKFYEIDTCCSEYDKRRVVNPDYDIESAVRTRRASSVADWPADITGAGELHDFPLTVFSPFMMSDRARDVLGEYTPLDFEFHRLSLDAPDEVLDGRSFFAVHSRFEVDCIDGRDEGGEDDDGNPLPAYGKGWRPGGVHPIIDPSRVPSDVGMFFVGRAGCTVVVTEPIAKVIRRSGLTLPRRLRRVVIGDEVEWD